VDSSLKGDLDGETVVLGSSLEAVGGTGNCVGGGVGDEEEGLVGTEIWIVVGSSVGAIGSASDFESEPEPWFCKYRMLVTAMTATERTNTTTNKTASFP